jgi:MFS family permease
VQHNTNRSYLLSVLLVILAFNYVDRLALGIVLQDIKVDLQLSDTQLGLLTGIAFALFYSVMGLPIARWADRGNRVTIITITTALWSAAVALCGVAGSFVQLLLIRVGVAVGEAGCVPPAHSLIGDYFSRIERPKALATYMLGQPLSMIIGYFAAGWLNELYGWRITFMLMGLPGLALAAIAWFTLRDPRFHPAALPSSQPIVQEEQPSMKQVWRTLWSSPSFRHLVFCFAVIQFFGYGILQWKPAFFIRSFGLETGELGVWFALIYGIGGLIGTYGGGVLASRLAAKNEALQLRGMAISYGGFGVISVGIYLSPNHYVAFALMSLATVGVAAIIGPLFATIQTLVPNRMRAVSIAIIYLFANLIGMGLGPMTAGIISDALRPHFGEESLRYALMLLSPGYLWAGWHLWQASKTIARDVYMLQVEREDVVPELRPGHPASRLHPGSVASK